MKNTLYSNISSRTIKRQQYLDSIVPEIATYNQENDLEMQFDLASCNGCAGTLGTAGSVGSLTGTFGSFGTAGTFGCYGCGS